LMLVEHDTTDPSAPLDERLEQTIRVRAILWEMLRPMREVHLLRDGAQWRHGTQNLIVQVRAAIRHHLLLTFRVELSAMPMDIDRSVAALQSTLSSANWDHLRFVQGYSVELTRDVMRHMAVAMLNYRVD
jgi:hypothetical protein